uniref:Uncharacterized protein n=1 Tax=Anguilla anguilla TaxID=7936 RepID=A0A0E9U5H7_ANGAN
MCNNVVKLSYCTLTLDLTVVSKLWKITSK